MDVFVRNIPFNIDRDKFIDEIAKVFHRRPYGLGADGSPINFEAVLHKPKTLRDPMRSSGLSLRTGIVTFPTSEIGKAFLDDYGEHGLIFGTHPQPALFRESNYPAKPQVVEKISRKPYLPPDQRKHLNYGHLDGERSNVKGVQFLWQCRDNIYSVEWEETSPFANGCLEFDEESSQITVTLFLEGPYTKNAVFISFSQIDTVFAKSTPDEHTILLNLTHPVQYRKLVAASRGFDSYPSEKWYRKSAICNGQSHVAPYTSITIRVIFSSLQKFEDFRTSWKNATNRPIHIYDYGLERRSLFSSEAINEVTAWLAQLDWPLAFHVNALVTNCTLDPKELISLRPDIQRLINERGLSYSEQFIRHFGEELDRLWFSDVTQSHESAKECFERLLAKDKLFESRRPIGPAEGLFECLHAIVTPTRLHLGGPFPEGMNRIMRRYATNIDAFLRVSFEDEHKTKFRFDHQVDGRTFINERVGTILREGLDIGGRHFEFLAYSQSALKEHAVWFVSPFRDTYGPEPQWVDAGSIIEGIGSFQNLAYDKDLIKCPARYAARLSQAFTTTDTSVEVDAEEIFVEEDIKRDNSNFTDGVGTVSLTLAEDIWRSLREKKRRGYAGHRPHPRAFQIRFQGSKGVVSVDYRLIGRVIVLRPSMIKFEALDLTTIEIAGVFNKPGKMFLNRPLIMLLEGLGVPMDTFLPLQRDAVKKIWSASTSLRETKYLLDNYGLGVSFRLSSTLQHLGKLRCAPKDKFYKTIIRLSILHALREIKYKARIPVPGWTLVGIADVHSFLKEGQVFVCIEEEKGKPTYLSGAVSILRSPTIHPGDVQIAEAIGPPPPDSPFAKERLSNTIVFSALGSRSLPSMLGGGDLDGDVYNVTDYAPLRPKHCYKAAAYDPARRKILDRASTMNDVIDFVVDFMNSDNVGIIATNWLIIADKRGIHDTDCLKLAKLHSDAVDYPKSGIPVPMNDVPTPDPIRTTPERPDWSEPETGFHSRINVYKSHKAIGRLFRDINLPNVLFQKNGPPQDSEEPEYDSAEDFDSEVPDITENMPLGNSPDGPRRLDEANKLIRRALQLRIAELLYDVRISKNRRSHLESIFADYVWRLRQICSTYSLSWRRKLTEEEVLVGTIKARTSDPRRRKDMISKVREQTRQLVADMIHEMIGIDEMSVDKQLKMAFAAWDMSQGKGEEFGARSFSWIALAALFEAIKAAEDDDRDKWSQMQTVYPTR